MKPRILASLAAVAVAFTLSACERLPQDSTQPSTPSASGASTQSTGGPDPTIQTALSISDLSTHYTAIATASSASRDSLYLQGGCDIAMVFTRALRRSDLTNSTQTFCSFRNIRDCGSALAHAQVLVMDLNELNAACINGRRGDSTLLTNLLASSQGYNNGLGLSPP